MSLCVLTVDPLIAIYVLQSRSRQEDPEQLRLKQKAKEVRWHTWDVYLVRGPLCLIMGQSWCMCAYGYRCSSRNWLRFDREMPTWRRWRLSDPERKENWILLHLGLTQRYEISLPPHGSLLPSTSSPSVPLCALFKSFSTCWAGLRCQVVHHGSQIVTNGRWYSVKA